MFFLVANPTIMVANADGTTALTAHCPGSNSHETLGRFILP
jgi:hypothetical protein